MTVPLPPPSQRHFCLCRFWGSFCKTFFWDVRSLCPHMRSPPEDFLPDAFLSPLICIRLLLLNNFVPIQLSAAADDCFPPLWWIIAYDLLRLNPHSAGIKAGFVVVRPFAGRSHGQNPAFIACSKYVGKRKHTNNHGRQTVTCRP